MMVPMQIRRALHATTQPNVEHMKIEEILQLILMDVYMPHSAHKVIGQLKVSFHPVKTSIVNT